MTTASTSAPPAVCERTVGCDQVIRAVAAFYGLRPDQIRGSRRHKTVALARSVAMYLARQFTGASYPELARSFGGKHHTTVIDAVQRVTSRTQRDPRLFMQVGTLRRALEQEVEALRS